MRLTKHRKLRRVANIQGIILALVLVLFFMGGYVKYEPSGDNIFHVYLNGTKVGVMEDKTTAKQLLIDARKAVASASNQLLFLRTNLTFVGETVIFGEVDTEESVRNNMEKVLAAETLPAMTNSYTVKIKEYMVNLATLQDVEKLLQAVVDKYHEGGQFKIAVVQDMEREFNVMTTQITDVASLNEVKEASMGTFPEAGIESELKRMFEELEQEAERDFGDFELGLSGMYFNEKIEIVESYLPIDQLSNIDVAINELVMAEEQKTIYKVQSGDTLSEIAEKVNIPMETIVSMNSSLKDVNATLHIGQELIITVPEPKISVIREEVNYYEETYEADVIYIPNDNWFTTDQEVRQQPSSGFRKVVVSEKYLNEDQIERVILKEEIVKEAVPKIVERGTKIPPTFIYPVKGARISSTFGRRNSPTAGASSYHKGVDWAVPTGTSIYASSGGTVTKAGWGGGYGYCVYITHSDGRETRYAHMSRVSVKAGEKVGQGQRIGYSGNTGISTGPHLHFEMIIRGTHVNPLNYLN